MPTNWNRLVLSWFLFAISISSALGATVVDYGSEWKYFVGTTEASSPDTTRWRLRSFDDSSWTAAPAPIGYAESPNNPAEFGIVTSLPSSQEAGYYSVFLRRKFTVANPASVGGMTLNIHVDDGFVVWINGTEVGRTNVPAGELSVAATASAPTEPNISQVALSNNLSSLLVQGENVIAVQVLNANLTSSDLFFDASVESDLDTVPPTLVDAAPARGTRVRELTTIEVVFSESVQGVDLWDLRINGATPSSLSSLSPRGYIYGFAQPATGIVHVAWSPTHGITDLGGNPFSPVNWDYVLDPTMIARDVVISEFMADNKSGIRDDDGNRSDWLELANFGDEAISLAGWFLTDDMTHPAKWRLPDVTLPPYGYLLIWASGNNRTNPPAPLHTNFKLAKDAGYLGLFDPRTNAVFEFVPAYPAQRADVSYGTDAADPGIQGFFADPTPGARNSTTGSAFASEPVFSREQGVFTNASVTVSLTASTGQVRYTLDGTVPTTNSPVASGTLTVSTTTTIKARTFRPGYFPSPVVARTYVLVDQSVATFRSKLPVMIVSTSGRGIVDHPAPGSPRTFASVVAVDTFRGLSSPLGTPNYIGQAGISIRGQTSSGFPKKPYRLELQDANRIDRDSALFGLPEGSDWVLNNPYTDKPFLQNFLAYELFEKMGHYSVRRKFVELFVNTSSGKVSYPRDYAGIYILLEKIEAGKDRVDIEKLTPYHTTEPEISGGYMFKKDKDSTGDRNLYTIGGAGFSAQALKIHEPGPGEITPQQLTWLTSYLRQFERALYASNWKTATGTNHYSWYIDVDSFVDQHWIVEFSKNIDGYRLSNYMQKDRNGKIKMEPVWDYNLSFGNADYLEGWNAQGWYYLLTDENSHIWLRRLMSGTTGASGTSGDPDFNQRLADRWSELRTNVFAASNVLARVDELAALLSEAAARDFQKWPRLGTYIWPNPGFYVTPTTYAGIIDAMKSWIQRRYAWIDSQFLAPPTFSLASGRIPPGVSLGLTGTGTIYYTLDGTDPRAPGGGVAAGAWAYSSPIQLNGNARFVARSRSGNKWSGPAGASFTVAPLPLVITEIMYNPAEPPSGSLHDAQEFEFLEFMNHGNAPMHLRGVTITDGVDFAFPDYPLQPGERVLVVRNASAFESRYGTGLPVVGQYTGQLNNAGERLTVKGPTGETILSFEYDNSWSPLTDGTGFSLVLRSTTGAAEDMAYAQNWSGGAVFNGSPAQPEPPAAEFPLVVVSEALTNPDPAVGKAVVELQNLSSKPADIGGWFLTDNFSEPKKFRIPPQTIVPPGGFVLFTGEDFGSAGALDSFSLNPLGEEIFLFSGGASTNLTGYVHGFEYGAQRTSQTFGRHVDSLGREHFVTQASSTVGATNSGPAIPAVVISEIMYHPPDVLANGTLWNNTEDEYIELHNRSASAVPLFDPSIPTNAWRLTGEARFVFPQGASIPAGGYVALVTFDPMGDPAAASAFRNKYQVPAGTELFGPLTGALDNRSGTLDLLAPGVPVTTGSAPYTIQERVQYSSEAPWNSGADGIGHSLSRLGPALFANDPPHWTAASPSPGRANGSPIPPPLVQHPSGRLAMVGQTLVLNAVPDTQESLRYQWRLNGRNIPDATNSTYAISNAQTNQTGEYRVVVVGSSASTVSEPAYVFIGTDGDGDGMDDAWELAHGLNPFDPTDSGNDLDTDGFTNLQEYYANTAPVDPGSRLSLHLLQAPGGWTMAFEAAPHRTYTIQSAEALTSIWTDVQREHARPFRRNVFFPGNSSGTARFYRVVTP